MARAEANLLMGRALEYRAGPRHPCGDHDGAGPRQSVGAVIEISVVGARQTSLAWPLLRDARPILRGAAIEQIADAVGRATCALIGGFVPRCQTGQSVAAIGYGTIVLVVVVAIMAVVSRRSA
jgi:hypothetical protein